MTFQAFFLKNPIKSWVYLHIVSSADNHGLLVRWLVIPILKPILMNMREMEKYLESECSDINYTVVRPPGLGNGPLSGTETKS